MLKKYSLYIVSVVILLFVVANSYLIAEEKYWGLFIPFLIAVIAMAVLRVDLLLTLVAFLTPLSTSLKELGIYNPIGVEMALPTEPLLFGLMIIAWVKMFSDKELFKGLYKHPVSILVGVYLFWLLLTAISSSMPLVSLKLFITRLWFISSFYVLGFAWFQDKSNVHRFVKAYLAGLSVVVVYTIIHHATKGFEHEAAHWVMSPFFKDHTSYGMALALLLPFAFYMRKWMTKGNLKLLFTSVLILLIVAIVLSYTRAAWLSLIAAICVYVVMKLRIRFSLLLTLATFFIGFVLIFQTDILMALEKNSQDSSDSFTEHIESMSNVSTDASNLERINRWKSALRLFEERPHLGWGAGTYQFNYAPYQNYYEKTIISTNAGNMGNAHSEYLSALAESGWPGLLIFLILIATIFTKAIVLYHKLDDKQEQWMLMACILGLVTYFTHAVLNNFLNMDKASVPIWAFVAIVVVLDLKHSQRKIEA
ncbi:MAG: O-antigen ligase family protein [Flavobacteriales bacterium]|nr:O-antigen ligase family protein [Flavobacteriales bacterium]